MGYTLANTFQVPGPQRWEVNPPSQQEKPHCHWLKNPLGSNWKVMIIISLIVMIIKMIIFIIKTATMVINQQSFASQQAKCCCHWLRNRLGSSRKEIDEHEYHQNHLQSSQIIWNTNIINMMIINIIIQPSPSYHQKDQNNPK